MRSHVQVPKKGYWAFFLSWRGRFALYGWLSPLPEMRRTFCHFGALSDYCCCSSGLMFSINAALHVCSAPLDAIFWYYLIVFPVYMLMCGQFCSSGSCLDLTGPGTCGGHCPCQRRHLEWWFEQGQWMVHQFRTYAEKSSEGSFERELVLSFPFVDLVAFALKFCFQTRLARCVYMGRYINLR